MTSSENYSIVDVRMNRRGERRHDLVLFTPERIDGTLQFGKPVKNGCGCSVGKRSDL